MSDPNPYADDSYKWGPPQPQGNPPTMPSFITVMSPSESIGTPPPPCCTGRLKPGSVG